MRDTTPTPPVGDPARLMRWSRWGILVAALVLGGAMVVSSGSIHFQVQHISRDLIHGQGQLMMDRLRQSLRELGHRPDEGDLERVFESLSGEGLRYLAFPLPYLSEVGSAVGGAPRVEPLPDNVPPQLLVTWVGERARAVWRAPLPLPPPGESPERRPPFPGPPPRRRGPEGPPPGAEPRGPPVATYRGLPPLVFEFEPLAAKQLIANSRQSLLASVATALALLLAALAAFRWLKGREELERRLARERHLASLGQMSAVLAHELRNPLASLKGHAQLLAEVLPEGRSRTKAERVVKEALRLEELTTGLLAFVRTGALHREATDPVAIVRAAAEEVEEGRVRLEADSAPGTWSLDAARMQQVLGNLLRNAIQAAPAGTPIIARVSAERGGLLYEVRDQGPGIPPGEETVIFEPFHTGKALGTGLGLAVARRVVELHGGSIHASNHPEGGALFRVYIPRAT